MIGAPIVHESHASATVACPAAHQNRQDESISLLISKLPAIDQAISADRPKL